MLTRNVRVPALLVFSVNENTMFGECDCRPTTLNVIDVAILANSTDVLYSMDVHHEPFSTSTLSREEDVPMRTAFGCMSLTYVAESQIGAEGSDAQQITRKLNRWAQMYGHGVSKAYSSSLENLRKRGYEEET